MRFKEFGKHVVETVSPVKPVDPAYKSNTTQTPPKFPVYTPPDKNKPKDDKDKPLVDLIAEKKKRKKKRKTKYAYGGYFYPGYAFTGDSSGDGGGDGGGGGESMYESAETADEVKKFAKWAVEKLHIKNPPKIELSYNTKEAQAGHHTGRHTVGGNSVWVYVNNRNLIDILRTVFHELVHWRQGELGKIKDGSSYPGSPIEAQADMLAGKYIKIYGKSNRNIFQ
jgi:hypothetical protein